MKVMGTQNRHQGSLRWGTPWCVTLHGLLLPLDPQQLWKARRGRTRQESCGWPLGLEGTSLRCWGLNRRLLDICPHTGSTILTQYNGLLGSGLLCPHRLTCPSQKSPQSTLGKLPTANPTQGLQPGTSVSHCHPLPEAACCGCCAEHSSPLQRRLPVSHSEALPFHPEEAGPGRRKEEK